MSENINELTEIQGSDLEGSAQPTDSTVGRSDPTGVPVKKFPLLTIILFIFLSLLAALAIYLFLQVRTLTLEATATPTPLPTPIAYVDPTANWQTYTNVRNHYSFQYPQTAKVLMDIGNANFVEATNDVDQLNVMIYGAQTLSLKIAPHNMWFGNKKLQYNNLREYVSVLNKVTNNKIIIPDSDSGGEEERRILLFEESKIDEKNSVRLRTQAEPGFGVSTDDIHETMYIETEPGYILEIVIVGGEPATDYSLVDQILSTFEFFDCNINESLNMTINLPNNWLCEANLDRADVGSLTLKSGDLTVSISDGGRGPYCGDGGDPENLCEENQLILSDNFQLTIFNYNGEDKELFGSLGKTTRDTNRWISVKYQDMETKKLSSDQKKELLNLYNSIQFTN